MANVSKTPSFIGKTQLSRSAMKRDAKRDAPWPTETLNYGLERHDPVPERLELTPGGPKPAPKRPNIAPERSELAPEWH